MKKRKLYAKKYWRLSLPDNYSSMIGSEGITLGHIEDQNECLFKGDWSIYEKEDRKVVHDHVAIKNNDEKCKTINVPHGMRLNWCFRDFGQLNTYTSKKFPPSNIGYFPTIFQAKTKIISYRHCSTNWDGLINSSIITVDINNNIIHNQSWDEKWIQELSKMMPDLEGNGMYWSNGGLQLYLDEEEKFLFIHSDDNGRNEASVILYWQNNNWKLHDIIKDNNMPSYYDHKIFINSWRMTN